MQTFHRGVNKSPDLRAIHAADALRAGKIFDGLSYHIF